jgi:hypothetical protein
MSKKKQALLAAAAEVDQDIKELNDRIHEIWSGDDISVVTQYDMQRCPKGSWNPHHYHRGGRCRCDEHDDAIDALSEATLVLRKAQSVYNLAKEWYSCS